MSLTLKPISFAEAKAYIREHHRHHKPPTGWKFGVAAEKDGKIVGVACAGRPVARKLDDGTTLEVNRLCTDGTRNACSMLYNAIRRAAKALGYSRVITYILETEDGGSLRASGWKLDGISPGGSWGCESRPREDHAPTCRKQRWVAEL